MNENDESLAQLADAARDEVQEDPRWEAMARGELSDSEREALLSREGAREIEPAFRPLDLSTRERIVDAIVAQASAQASGEPAPAAKTSAKPALKLVASNPTREADGGDVTKVAAPHVAAKMASKPRRFLPAALLAGAISAAAAVAAMWSGHATNLPSYSVSVQGGERIERGASAPSDAVPRVGPGSRLSITLRPAERIEGVIEARAVLRRGGEVRAWAPAFEAAEGGALRVSGTRESLFAGVPAGDWELVFAVGRASDLPSVSALTQLSGNDKAEPSSYKLLRYRVLIANGAGGE